MIICSQPRKECPVSSRCVFFQCLLSNRITALVCFSYCRSKFSMINHQSLDLYCAILQLCSWCSIFLSYLLCSLPTFAVMTMNSTTGVCFDFSYHVSGVLEAEAGWDPVWLGCGRLWIGGGRVAITIKKNLQKITIIRNYWCLILIAFAWVVKILTWGNNVL